MIKILSMLGATFAIGFLGMTPAVASISITSSGTTSGSTYALDSGAYEQSFDSLPATGTFTWANDSTLPGWSAANGTGGLNTTGKTINGTATNPDDLTLSSVGAAGSNDRALAYHTRVDTAPTHLGLAFANNSGQTISSFTLAYSPEQWKEATNSRTVTVTVEYRVGATLADLHASSGWTTLPGLEFSTLNGSAPSTTTLTYSNIPVSVPAGASLWVRWVFANTATSSTISHDILAIDNVTFSAATGTPVDSAPTITTQPVSQTASVGGSVTFSASASGQPTPTFQWFKGANSISGATSASFTINPVALTDAGDYSVTATNTLGSAPSTPATLAVNAAPVAPAITSQPTDQNVTAGSSATFTVVASGTAPLAYQWFKGVASIPGANNASYVINSVSAADAGTYSVTVTNAATSVTSDTATLSVVVGSGAPAIVASPVSITRMLGGGATFKAAFSGSEPMTYAWYKNNVLLPTATGNKLTLTGLTANDAGVYRVTATNAVSSASSASASLTVTSNLPDSTFNLYGFAAQPIYPGVPSNSFSPATTTGGGVIPETDPAYRKVSTPLEFAQAVGAANKGQGVKVIEIMNDLDLGWNEIGTAVQNVTNTPFAAALPAQLHPKLLTTGVSSITINPKNGGLTIFSANGSAIRHCLWGVKSTANIMIRNLKFDELWEWDEASPKPGDYDKNNWDFITLSVGGGTVDHVWIDHCTFTKSYDGIVDNKGGVSNVTHSWNKYEGDDGATNSNSFVRQQINLLESNKSAYPMYDFLRTHGFSLEDIVQILQGPDKTTAIGELSLKPVNVNASITFHHQWYINTWDRLPRLAGGTAHNYNIYVDDTLVQQAKRLRDARYNAMNSADRATFTTNYNFNPPINGSISTEDGALFVEKSVYIDCNWPLRNNQTDPSNPTYTGKIKATDTIYIYHNTNGTTTNVRGNSTDPGNPLGPFQATIKPFSWNTADGSAPYTLPASAYHDPALLGEIVAAGSGAGALTWDKSNWLKTSYTDPEMDTFAAWSTRNAVSGANSDPDGDGIGNLLEFGLGLNPQQASTQGLPTLANTAGQRVFRFTRPNNLGGLTYTVQTSTDLVNWSGTLTTSIESSTATTETVVATVPQDLPSRFVKLRIVQQ